MAYATVAQLRQLISTDMNIHDVLLAQLIARAQVYLDEEIGFSFEAAADTTRYFDAASILRGGNVDGPRLYFDTWICATPTTVTNGDTTVITSTYYVKEPRNAAPYYAITLLGSSGYSWEGKSTGDTENAITVVGKFAHNTSAPADINEATLEIALWNYRRRSGSLDDDRAILTSSGVYLPGQLPKKVTDIIDRHRWRTK